MLGRKRTSKSAFVPRSIFRMSLAGAGVIPFCAAASLTAPACGDSGQMVGVACSCYADAGGLACPPGSCLGVAASCYTDPSLPFCHDGGEGGRDVGTADAEAGDALDAPNDGLAVADAFGDGPRKDGPLGVAGDAFGGG